MTEQLITETVKQVVKQAVKQLSNYQKYYMHYSWPQSLAMTLIAAFSNFMSIPLIFVCFKRNHIFVGLMCLLSMLTSFLYHFCQIYDCKIFLDFSAWHRLDNVFAVTCMSLYLLYLTGNIYEMGLVYSTVIVAILAQEKDPWNLAYTIVPIVGFGVIGLGVNLGKRKGVPEFRYEKLMKGTGLLVIGGYFFANGLDQHTDYLRLNHGIWHFFLGWASYYNMDSIQLRERREEYVLVSHSE